MSVLEVMSISNPAQLAFYSCTLYCTALLVFICAIYVTLIYIYVILYNMCEAVLVLLYGCHLTVRYSYWVH
jgi:hypothetical protein